MTHDNINHPSYYTQGNIETIDYIEDKKLGYHLGNVIKYVSRAGKKVGSSEIDDLKKAKWYLARHIELLGENRVKKIDVWNETKMYIDGTEFKSTKIFCPHCGEKIILDEDII